MSEERLITVPNNARVFCIPQEYLAICQRERVRKVTDKETGTKQKITYMESDECAAAILRIIERWTVWKIKQSKRRPSGEQWVWMSQSDLREWELLGAYGEYRVTQAIKLLVQKGYIETRNNPKSTWDRTIQYRFNLEAIQADIDQLPPFRNITEWRAQYHEMDTAISQNDPQIPSQIPSQAAVEGANIPAWLLESPSDESPENDKTPPPPDEAEPNTSPDLARVCTSYENNIAMLTPIMRERLIAAVDEYPAEWIINAITEAVEHNARKWSYIEAILKRWKVEGPKVDSKNSGKITRPINRLGKSDPNCPICGGTGIVQSSAAVGELGYGETYVCSCRKTPQVQKVAS